jgi:hypothetical protein
MLNINKNNQSKSKEIIPTVRIKKHMKIKTRKIKNNNHIMIINIRKEETVVQIDEIDMMMKMID